MEGIYEVRLGDRAAGTVRVERQGLYYRFSCRCSLSGERMHRLVLRRGGVETDLGLCVPMAGAFGTEKRIPAARCGQGTPEFILRPKGASERGQFIPLSPEEPFRYLHRLQDAHLERRDGTLGIVIGK